jgi:hypothetical protein
MSPPSPPSGVRDREACKEDTPERSERPSNEAVANPNPNPGDREEALWTMETDMSIEMQSLGLDSRVVQGMCEVSLIMGPLSSFSVSS